MRGQRFPLIAHGAGLGFPLSCRASIGAWVVCRHVPLPVARSRFVPAQGSRQSRASPLPLASVTPPACCRSCPSPATGGAFLRVKVSPVSPFTGER